MNKAGESGRVWSVVLAGGEGERMKPFVQQWLGCQRPKQYCTFVGNRSMFQHTLSRAGHISGCKCTVTVVSRSHRDDAVAQSEGGESATVIFQPANRGTAAGLFLALAHVRRLDPEATVVLLPSDHFIYPEEAFASLVCGATRAVRFHKDRLFLFGVPPDSMETEYGWIYRGTRLDWIAGIRVSTVQRFVEKPSREVCARAIRSGALWNTLVIVGNQNTMWQLGKQCFPDLISSFEVYQDAIGSLREESILESLYQRTHMHDLSSGLLSAVVDQLVAIELDGIIWSDWGRPERIISTLRRIGKSPVFPIALAQQCSGPTRLWMPEISKREKGAVRND
ncbi:MAG: sugar phosphate nucleotidyltransferase [Acidobacteriota bacterium]